MAKKKVKRKTTPKPPEPVGVYEDPSIEDDLDQKIAYRIGLVGVGQAGGRIAEQFYEIGYRSVCAVNTADVDLAALDEDMPKVDLGTGGAGKNPAAAAKIAEHKYEEIYESCFIESIGDEVDYILVCAGLGGGTGSGATPVLLRAAKEYAQEIGLPEDRVGCILTLPAPTEGPTVAANAVHAFECIQKMKPKPLFLLDNRAIDRIYRPPISKHFETANVQVSHILHLFNHLAAQKAEFVSFDRSDFSSLLEMGICVFGASSINDYSKSTQISNTVRNDLDKNTFAEVDRATAKGAGCVFLVPEEAKDHVAMEYFDRCFSMINRQMAEGSLLHRGIYQVDEAGEALKCFTLWAGMRPPEDTLNQLRKQAGALIEQDALSKHFGI